MAKSKYEPVSAGLRQVALSGGMAQASLALGRKLAGNANAVGDSGYEAANQTVLVGWRNERRQGAVVREVDPHWRDSRDRILLRVTASMKVRSR